MAKDAKLMQSIYNKAKINNQIKYDSNILQDVNQGSNLKASEVLRSNPRRSFRPRQNVLPH